MIYSKHLALTFSLFALSPFAFAETSNKSATAEDKDTEETFITATRTSLTPFEALASVDVLSQEDILTYQFSDLAEAFQSLAGIDVIRTGGIGSNTSLYTRGTNNGHTLMLINGQRFSSATLGETAFQLLDPLLIKKAEFVRGSRSALYGSEAIGGVAQLFTVDKNAEAESYVHLEAGSFNTYRSAVGTQASIGKFNYSAGLSYTGSDGIDHLVDDTDKNADEDGFESISLNLFGLYTFDSEAELGLSYLRNQSQSDYDNPYSSDTSPFRTNLIEASQISLYVPLADHFDSQVNLGLSRDKSEESDLSFFETQRHSLYWQNNWMFASIGKLSFGLDYYEESVDASVEYTEAERDSLAPFAQLQLDLAMFDFLIGARSDDNSSYEGTEDLGSFAAGVSFDDAHRLYISWNEGFKAPSFNDLYWPFSGNADLKHELSENKEIGFKAQYNTLDWEISAYHYDIENLIAWAPNTEGIWQPANINAAEIKGVELSTSTTVSDFFIDASFSYTKPIDKTTEQTLAYRAKRKFSLLAQHNLEKFDYGFIFQSLSDREAFGSAIDDYSLINFFANYQLRKDFTLGLKISNLLDEEYQANPSYNTEGRNIKANLHYIF